MPSRFLEELNNRILIFDGAMGTSIQGYNLKYDDYKGKDGCNEYLVITRANIIKEIHKSYLEAGCDVIETNTFGANRFKLKEYALDDKIYEINYKASCIAREVADSFSTKEKPRFVVGSIGPSGFLPSSSDPDLSKVQFDELAYVFAEQAKALVDGGVDALLIETSQDMLEVKSAIYGIKKFFKENGNKLPLIVQITLDTSGKMLLGTDITSALTTIESMEADVIGMNCSTGPKDMRDPARYLCENTNLKISIIPNAGIPVNQDGKAVYLLSPDKMAEQLSDFIKEFGVNIIGGCCGTSPDHIRELSKAFATIPPKQRRVDKNVYVSSSMKSVCLKQEPRPLIVGERINAQGSRKVKRLLLEEDYQSIIKIAREQLNYGAHILDVCVAITERDDEPETMQKLLKLLSMSIETPVMVDSTDYNVVEIALKNYAGTIIVNSINLENGREKADKILSLINDYGGAVVALTIDEKGMAKTLDRKIEISQKLYDIYVNEYNFKPGSLIIDLLTFTLATGEDEWKNSAIETINAIKEIKSRFPKVLTSLGVSNCSFGLNPYARKILNSIYLYHSVQAGLDIAMVNPKDIIPYPSIPNKERVLVENLIFNRSDNALSDLIAHFEKNDKPKNNKKTSSNLLSVEETIHNKVLHRDSDQIEELLDEAMEKYSPVEVLNNILLNAMKDVGDKFGTGELILPFVLQSAEVMKKAVNYLEGFLEDKAISTKAAVLLATVYGDVHDIGKNLFKTILTNNGYVVHDIGKQVPVQTIIEKAVKLKVDAIGLSALLVSTSKQMAICIEELYKNGYNYPVLIGGAAINQDYGYRIAFVDDKTIYSGGVFYGKDVFQGLEIMDSLSDKDKKHLIIKENKDKAIKYIGKKKNKSKVPEEKTIKKSNINRVNDIPNPPFWGTKVILEKDINMNELFDNLNLTELFRLSWGGRGKKLSEYKLLVENEFKPLLNNLKQYIKENSIFSPKIVYGYFPCLSHEDRLIIFDPVNQSKELTHIDFPRQNKEPYLCLSDYFFPISSNKMDLIAIQVVTVGDKVSKLCHELNEKNSYTKSYYIHGLAVQTAEAMAQYNHNKIRAELNLANNRGNRYSFGYSSCPNLEESGKIMSIMQVEKSIGVSLTDGFQLVPEQSTSALIIHHPDAVYYRV